MCKEYITILQHVSAVLFVYKNLDEMKEAAYPFLPPARKWQNIGAIKESQSAVASFGHELRSWACVIKAHPCQLIFPWPPPH